ncbi:hypothetical protein KFE25_004807 [Diacronema lutheri]|uniref:Sialidase domain-containing protein n=2 Tax=Diacronema lutheri TaxID=2081491 RepID=A0A8J6C9R9_DIALT|nr:hypothetical protein KFE25_004807 [Diacronema lutheri]
MAAARADLGARASAEERDERMFAASETSSVSSEAELLARSAPIGPLFDRGRSGSLDVTATDDDDPLHIGGLDHMGRRPWHPRSSRWRRAARYVGAALAIALLLALALRALPRRRTGVGARVDVFVARTERGYERGCFRIPALLAVPRKEQPASADASARTRLLAFAEGRRVGCTDAGAIDVVMRSSDDGGRSWSALRVVTTGGAAGYSGEATVGNPTPIFDARNDRVLLLLTANRAEDSEAAIISRLAAGSRDVLVVHSDDRGESWSRPRNITADVKLRDWTWYATGPGAGIQLRSGRLVAPCNHVVTSERPPSVRHESHAILSDDGGLTWRLGGLAAAWTNEATVAELPHADVLVLNCRQMAGARRRVVMRSTDGGESWAHAGYDAELVEPGCQGHLLALPARAHPPLRSGGLFFSNPADPHARRMLALRFRPSLAGALARNGSAAASVGAPGSVMRVGPIAAHTPPSSGPVAAGGEIADARWRGQGGWQEPMLIHPGPAAYSAMALIGDDRLGVLYENGAALPIERISLTVVAFGAFEAAAAANAAAAEASGRASSSPRGVS